MAAPPAKLARLQSLRSRLPYVSQSALSQILQLAEQEQLPEECSRNDVRKARNAVVEERTPYGTLHQTITVDGNPLEVQHPFAMLWHSCASSASVSGLISRAFAASPCTLSMPWSLILYADEILPGNQLAYKNKRKMWRIYWTILNLGSAALSDEELLHKLAFHESCVPE